MTKICILAFAVLSFFYGNAQNPERILQQDDPRFTIKYKYGWNSISEYETCNFYVHNNTTQILSLVVDVTISWTCNRTFSFKLGYNNIVYIKPGGNFTAENDDWVHSIETKAHKKECILTTSNGDRTTINNVTFNISNVKQIAVINSP